MGYFHSWATGLQSRFSASQPPGAIGFACAHSANDREGTLSQLPEFSPQDIAPSTSAHYRIHFLLGRLAAHRALTQLNADPDGPIERDSRGAPQWPEGIVGSISHSSQLGVALVGPSSAWNGVGVDLERVARPVSTAVVKRIAHQEELAWISGADHIPAFGGKAPAALALFSAKESAFKAFFPLYQKTMGFHHVKLCPDENSLRGELMAETGPFRAGFRFTVELAVEGEYLLSAILLCR